VRPCSRDKTAYPARQRTISAAVRRTPSPFDQSDGSDPPAAALPWEAIGMNSVRRFSSEADKEPLIGAEKQAILKMRTRARFWDTLTPLDSPICEFKVGRNRTDCTTQ
jgi:hypothetical protein